MNWNDFPSQDLGEAVYSSRIVFHLPDEKDVIKLSSSCGVDYMKCLCDIFRINFLSSNFLPDFPHKLNQFDVTFFPKVSLKYSLTLIQSPTKTFSFPCIGSPHKSPVL